MASKTRLYVDHPLGAGQLVPLSQDQAHYLFSVMRLPVGAVITVFNGQHGAWDAQVAEAGKRKGLLACVAQTQALQMPPDLWLLFAPIRKERTAFIVEKATEMGAARVLPVRTEFTQKANRVRQDKLQAHAIEAAEQCGGTFVPEVAELAKITTVLEGWDSNRRLLFCDEAMVGAALDMPDMRGPWAILIGPEGGFSEAERARLRGLDYAHTLSLGPRILRADTAAVAALTVWQQALGDW